MKTVNVILLQLMITTSILMSVVETARFINNPQQLPSQIEEPVLVVRKILQNKDLKKAELNAETDKEQILSYKTLVRCWNYITEDQ